MENNERTKNLENILQNDIVVEQLNNSESLEDVQKILAANGLELSKEEVVAFGKTLFAYSENNDLSEEELENVAGGVTPKGIFSASWKILKRIGGPLFDFGRRGVEKGWW